MKKLTFIKTNNETYIRKLDLLNFIEEQTEAAIKATPALTAMYETFSHEIRKHIAYVGMSDADIKAARKRIMEIPPRYAVGKEEGDHFLFYVESQDGKSIFSNKPCMAKMYKRYKEAEACADFADDEPCVVIDMFDAMSKDERLRRGLFAEDEDDEGNEKAVPLFLT